VHEQHYMGPDGRPAWHRTQQVIDATEAWLDRYPYRCDTSPLAIEPPPPEMRRVSRRAMHNVSMRVEFHPDKLPRHVWWAVWDGLDGEIVERDECGLRASRYVFKRLDTIEQSVAGFTWQW
jgi:hypothetical protein